MTNDFKDEGEEHLRQHVKESCATETKVEIQNKIAYFYNVWIPVCTGMT